MRFSAIFRKAVITVVFALIPALSFAAVPASQGNGLGYMNASQLANQSRELSRFADSFGFSVSPIRLQWNQIASDAGHVTAMAASCTATATVSIPGGTGITLSATAPTCQQAMKMITTAIQQYIHMMAQ